MIAYLTSEIMEQYLHCPRYFYLYKIKGIRLTIDSIWSAVEELRTDINQITFQFISQLSTLLGLHGGERVTNLPNLEKILPLDYSCVLSTQIYLFSDSELVSKVYAFLNFVFLSIYQESKKDGKKKRVPVGITFLPQPKDSQGIIMENPTAIIDYSDSKQVVIYQKFSLPAASCEKSSLNLLNLFLVGLYKSTLTRIVSVDYRNMEISVDSISSYKSRKYRSNLNTLLNNHELKVFEPSVSSSCNTCEFKLGCEISEEVINYG